MVLNPVKRGPVVGCPSDVSSNLIKGSMSRSPAGVWHYWKIHRKATVAPFNKRYYPYCAVLVGSSSFFLQSRLNEI